ncbi:MAG TPA: hypothetical protein VMV19_17855 [Xanthobacteraceae bacterium]|nr:hypothetical protein [Xanthobacteraceae bacterium]
MADTLRMPAATSPPGLASPFDRLAPLGFGTGLLVICGFMLASFLIAGFWFAYWRVADMDLWVVYNAFLLNTPLPQEYFDHPGYLSILLLSYWLRALHAAGLIHVTSLSGIPPVSNAANFADVWMRATQAGRVLSFMFMIAYVVAFACLVKAIVGDRRIAGLAGFFLACAGGLTMQMRIMRTELLATGFFMIALLILIAVAKRGERAWRPAVVGFASLLITLGMLNKIQILFLICALPILVLPFGPEAKPQSGFWRLSRYAWPAVAASAIIAAVAAFLAKDIVIAGMAGKIGASLRIGSAIYLPALAVWVGVAMAAYALIWRTPAAETLAAMFAVIAGCMIALLALDIRYNVMNAVVVFHPIEQMFAWASGAEPDVVNASTRYAFLLRSIGGVIARHIYLLHPSSRPTIFVEWFVIAAAVIAVRRRKWMVVAQVAPLMLTVWCVDTLSMGRGLKQEYFTLTDPLIIVAAALLIAELVDLQYHRWTYRLGALLIAANAVISQFEPVKQAYLRKEGPEIWCHLYPYAVRIEHYPFCPPLPGRG